MADLTVVARNVGTNFTDQCKVRGRRVAVAVTAGVALSFSTTGTVVIAGAATAGTEQFRGLALDNVGAGETSRICEDGWVSGFDLSGLAYDAPVYLSNTPGLLSTTAGTKTVIVGRVDFMNDSAKTKVLRVYGGRAQQW